jgi:hypothetical protein
MWPRCESYWSDTDAIFPRKRRGKGWHWNLFSLGRQEDSPSLFSKGTAPPWNSEARPVVMEFLESMEDSVTQPPY